MKAPWSGEHSPPPAGRVGATPQRPSARAAWVLCLPLGLALPGVYYLLLVTGPSLRGLKDTGDFWGHCAWRFLRRHRAHRASLWGETWAGMSSPRPWHGEVCFCRKLLIPAAREPGAHLPAPAPRTGAGTWWGGGGDGGGGDMPCSISACDLPTGSPLSEEKDLSWREEHKQDFLEQSAGPALQERRPKNPGSNS